MKVVRIGCGYQHGLEIEVEGSKGGMCLASKESIEIKLLKFATNFIDVLVRKE